MHLLEECRVGEFGRRGPKEVGRLGHVDFWILTLLYGPEREVAGEVPASIDECLWFSVRLFQSLINGVLVQVQRALKVRVNAGRPRLHGRVRCDDSRSNVAKV